MNKFFKNIKEEANYKIVLFICVFITLYNFVYTNITYDYPIIKKIFIGIFVFITLFSNWLLFKCKNLGTLKNDRFSIKNIDQVAKYVH